MKKRTKELIDFLKAIEQKFLQEVDKGADDYHMEEIIQRLMQYDELRQAYNALIDFMSEIADNLEKHGKSK